MKLAWTRVGACAVAALLAVCTCGAALAATPRPTGAKLTTRTTVTTWPKVNPDAKLSTVARATPAAKVTPGNTVTPKVSAQKRVLRAVTAPTGAKVTPKVAPKVTSKVIPIETTKVTAPKRVSRAVTSHIGTKVTQKIIPKVTNKVTHKVTAPKRVSRAVTVAPGAQVTVATAAANPTPPHTTVPTTLQPCTKGTYRQGKICVTCPEHCLGNDCDPNIGTCSKGCLPGYDFSKNTKCTLACTGNRWGANCGTPCGNCYGAAQCDVTNGSCKRCAAGYKMGAGNRCKEKCNTKTYGQDCKGRCGKCAAPTDCNHVTGACAKGCLPGAWGSSCTGSCSAHCRDPDTCDFKSGSCPCVPGFKPGRCTQVCDKGRYGQNCTATCGYCQRPRLSPTTILPMCNDTNGHCERCEDNRLPPLCQDCKPGWWGPRCLQKCGHCGGGGGCDAEAGRCVALACAPGYVLPDCTNPCQAGRHGTNCSSTCGSCLDGGACRHDSGVCEQGCRQGYRGVLCTEEEEGLTGAIVGSILGAAGIIAIAIVVVGFMKYCRGRRRDNLSNGKPDKHTDDFATFAEMHTAVGSEPGRPSVVYQNVNRHDGNYDTVQRFQGQGSGDNHVYDSHCPAGANLTDAADGHPPARVSHDDPKGHGQRRGHAKGQGHDGGDKDGGATPEPLYGNIGVPPHREAGGGEGDGGGKAGRRNKKRKEQEPANHYGNVEF